MQANRTRNAHKLRAERGVVNLKGDAERSGMSSRASHALDKVAALGNSGKPTFPFIWILFTVVRS